MTPLARPDLMLNELLAEAPEIGDFDPWPPPAPLTCEPSSVPVDGLPTVVRDMVRAVEASVQAPVEVPLGFALSAISAATRGCWDIDITSSWRGEPPSLYVVTLADSGERKSAGMRPLLHVLHEAEKRLAIEVKAKNRDRSLRRKAAEARIKRVPEDEDAALREAAVIHENRPRPVPELILSDTTTEALGMNMAHQGGAASLFITEATAFRTVAGAYSDKGKGGNVGLLNHSYDAERYTDKRVNRGGVTIPRPFLSWGAAVQPQVLTGYADGTTEGSGFLARFLLLLPKSRVGQRLMRTDAIPPTVQAAWDTALTALHARAWDHYSAMTDDPDEFGQPLTLHFDADAAEILLDYGQELEDRKGGDHELRDLGGWIEKHPARLARIAALFALLEDPYARSVTVAQVQAAMTLAAPFIEHATATLRILRNTGDSGPVHRVLDVLRQAGQPSLTTREVYHRVKNQGWVNGTEAVREVLHGLQDDGWVRVETRSTGGRPSEAWRLHPQLLARGR